MYVCMFVYSISLGMSALLKKEARLKHELNKLKQTLKHTNVELEKSLVDKDHFTKWEREREREKYVLLTTAIVSC